jgi:hypothetical protein
MKNTVPVVASVLRMETDIVIWIRFSHAWQPECSSLVGKRTTTNTILTADAVTAEKEL